jgi:hypothetical protein
LEGKTLKNRGEIQILFISKSTIRQNLGSFIQELVCLLYASHLQFGTTIPLLMGPAENKMAATAAKGVLYASAFSPILPTKAPFRW